MGKKIKFGTLKVIYIRNVIKIKCHYSREERIVMGVECGISQI